MLMCFKLQSMHTGNKQSNKYRLISPYCFRNRSPWHFQVRIYQEKCLQVQHSDSNTRSRFFFSRTISDWCLTLIPSLNRNKALTLKRDPDRPIGTLCCGPIVTVCYGKKNRYRVSLTRLTVTQQWVEHHEIFCGSNRDQGVFRDGAFMITGTFASCDADA